LYPVAYPLQVVDEEVLVHCPNTTVSDGVVLGRVFGQHYNLAVTVGCR